MTTQEVSRRLVELSRHGKIEDVLEEFHGAKISDPQVAGDYFSISWWMDATMKGQGRSEMQEICVYQVKDGKIVSEQFFY